MTTLIDVRLPHMGSVERAVITAWHKSPGDKVAVDEPLLDVSTDKVDTEVASPQEGTLVQILAAPDQEVPVGELIARFAPLDASEAQIAAALDAGAKTTGPPETPVAPQAPVAVPTSATAPTDPAGTTGPAPAERAAAGRTDPAPAEPVAVEQPDLDGLSLVLRDAFRHLAVRGAGGERGGPTAGSPLVRRMAKEAGIDLSAVPGTGPGGRVTRDDVRAYVAKGGSTAAVDTASPVRPAVPTAPAAPTTSATTLPPGYDDLPREEVPLSPVRKATAAHMVASVSTAPQLTAQVDVDFSRLTAVRAEINAERARRGDDKLSYLPFIARALVAVTAEHPDINATFTDTHLLRWRTVNLGVAVDVEAGLYVPVVRDAQRLSLDGLAQSITDLARRARERRLKSADLEGGTITISNSGSVGGVIATPILTRPQVASLGVPAVVRQPVAVIADNGEEYIAVRPVARLGLTFDHRAMDGSGALRALIALQRALQEWSADAYR
ncbi:pyruvate/2-oxoglutarate dehydrogenase complex dihydrolipoamide acyltransferase (E2) component [Streptomyces sp. SAI-135]|jgi:2-oxoglutarate dehydrogenase E2 component (dihydrolipoamide succinyltransferase)|uniref:dihydrolipoamide acetyltransferase family protein n=1 Tax=unclassified Streptomyces TaxID=2593676 RepID=UPI002476AC36|nr:MULTISPECIES: dihydrolipoamide acetyltransferase family protein [unclassified Streptomyces]MDH6521930.1 pyruvate/2-oxoglutarate dehydrogenase complex dihydrolipoamide acyltransferase (E2) component [Streptomyces sp. SAI-090]MDH6573299.1 pyruvate/2-oxoglutarate dehydrogenase complex dihydrolipoamide acyltransferase (E2) component [Streptomyces sp. SAI-117]MDH6613968.1 pyruvate/2-oxoglutarate dehydrogenase complex dihydrolipoamide acyltransferase (E2) component [Streptomyces sp. SAI-135]